MPDEARFWERIRACEDQLFYTLTSHNPNKVRSVTDDGLKVHTLAGVPPRLGGARPMERRELYGIYRHLIECGPVALKDISPGLKKGDSAGRLAHLRTTPGRRSGAAMLGLLLFAFQDELIKRKGPGGTYLARRA